MKFVNYTPHIVQVWNEDKVVLIVPPEDKPLRAQEKIYNSYQKNNVWFCTVAYGECSPPPKIKGTIYIVSILVAQLFPDRSDFVFPYDLVRNKNGSIIGCRKLASYYQEDRGEEY